MVPVGRDGTLADLESLKSSMGRHGDSIGSLEMTEDLQAASIHSWVGLRTVTPN